MTTIHCLATNNSFFWFCMIYFMNISKFFI
nr:MAG TPA: hypothetical protein [Bacteriophage sp.]